MLDFFVLLLCFLFFQFHLYIWKDSLYLFLLKVYFVANLENEKKSITLHYIFLQFTSGTVQTLGFSYLILVLKNICNDNWMETFVLAELLFLPLFLGELQPMASSTSVASLVITLETGLSDEEGPLEPSHLGDKSWEGGGPWRRNRSHEWLRSRLYAANADQNPSWLPSLLQNSAALHFGLKMKTWWFWIQCPGSPPAQTLLGQARPGRRTRTRLFNSLFWVLLLRLSSTRDRKRTFSYLNICETCVTTFPAHSWWNSKRIVCEWARTREGLHLRHWTTGSSVSAGLLQFETGITGFCGWILALSCPPPKKKSYYVLPGAMNGSFGAFVLKGHSSTLPACTVLQQSRGAVPLSILLRFSQIVFFFSLSCPDFQPVSCTCCRVCSQESSLTPRCDKGVYVKPCRAAMERFSVSNSSTLRTRRLHGPLFVFMLEAVGCSRSLLSSVKCLWCICPSASWSAPVEPFRTSSSMWPSFPVLPSVPTPPLEKLKQNPAHFRH